MAAKFKLIGETFDQLNKEFLGEVKSKGLDNVKRRKFHSKLELLRLDLLELEESATESQKSIIEKICSEIDKIIPQLNIVPVQRTGKWWNQLEVSIRFLGVCSSFFLIGSMCSLPIIALRGVDQWLQMDPFHYRSEVFKKAITWLLLYQSGILVDVQGVSNDFFKETCALLCFNHASNVDGFLVASICPIRQLAFGKKELFMVPFFSWISLAIGGVPVDRGNRDRAVGALKRSVESAKSSKVCIAVAPEGTRSLTGQLLPFKKGPFHMWDELKAPIVPMLIFGAYDLYPVGSWVNQTGHIAVRYLKPVLHTEAENKDKMLLLLRRRMLEGLSDCPEDIGRELSTFHWAASITVNLLFVVLLLVIMLASKHVCTEWLHMSLLLGAFWWAVSVALITAGLFVYYVYLIDLGKGGSDVSRLSSSSGSEKSTSSDKKKKK